MKLKLAQKISDEVLRNAYLAATVPVKKLGLFTLEIFDAVGDLKAAQARGKDASASWAKVRTVLDLATEAGDFSAFDDFTKAWSTLEVSTACLRIGGEDFPCYTAFKNKPRARVTRGVVLAIECLQDMLDRAPTRQEVLHFMATHEAMVDPIDIDDSELCVQLRKLGLQELLPTARDLGS